MTWNKTCITRKCCNAESWRDLAETIAGATGWKDDSEVFAYTESLHDCALERLRFDAVSAKLSSLPKPFEGRIFDSQVETRWRRMQDGQWAAWVVEEHENGDEPARRRTRLYYLRGTGAQGKGEFQEARYPRRFEYPVQCARHRDRACIEVAEYWRVEPDWTTLPDTAAGQALEQPLLFAHRFVDVGTGRGATETSNGKEKA